MKGIILAAGLGTRLRPLTDHSPKTLVKIGNKPILGYQIDALLENGIEDIVICTGYQSIKIRDFCKNIYPKANIKFVDNVDFESTNNMYSLYLAENYIDGDLFIMNGDVAIDKEIVTEMKEIDKSCVATDVGRYIGESMKVVVGEAGEIVDIAKTIPVGDAYGSSIDVYKFVASDTLVLKEALKEYFDNGGDKKQWTEVMFQNLFKNRKINPVPHNVNNARWLEVDDHEDLEIANGIFHRASKEFNDKKIVFLDGDGTLFVGNKLIKGAEKFFQYLLSKDLKVYVLSNNTSKTPLEYAKKLKDLGLPVEAGNILLPSSVLMEDLRSEGIKDLYLVANDNVNSQFLSEGFNTNSDTPQAVVLTYDTELTYKKLYEASLHLHKGVKYFATHIDLVCPTEFGPVPDIGSIIEMLKTTTGREPERTYGKPAQQLLLNTLKKHELTKDDAIIFGDRIYTDIRMGNEAGVFSVLVLSGETTDDDIKSSNYKPDVVVKNVSQFLSLFK